MRINDNPLSALVARGIFIAWPNLVFMFIFLFFTLFGKINFACFGVFLLFLQRPYIHNQGYSLLYILVIFVQLLNIRKKPSMFCYWKVNKKAVSSNPDLFDLECLK
jgi:hypothetical protein